MAFGLQSRSSARDSIAIGLSLKRLKKTARRLVLSSAIGLRSIAFGQKSSGIGSDSIAIGTHPWLLIETLSQLVRVVFYWK